MPTPSRSAIGFTRLSIALVVAVAAIAATARAQAPTVPLHSDIAIPALAVVVIR